MRIAVIGAGNVGTTLGRRLANSGHTIVYGVRDPESAKYSGLNGGGLEVRSVPDAVRAADAVILSTPWDGTEAAVRLAGDFQGKPLLDATNPIGPGFALTHGHTDSGAEQVARWATNAKVVKVFNTTGLENMADPVYGDARAAMFVCGDDTGACAVAVDLAKGIGFDAVLIGNLAKARVLEPAAMLWIKLALVLGNRRNVAFGLLRREARS